MGGVLASFMEEFMGVGRFKESFGVQNAGFVECGSFKYRYVQKVGRMFGKRVFQFNGRVMTVESVAENLEVLFGMSPDDEDVV